MNQPNLPPSLFTDNGVRLHIQASPLARGGEGAVHRISQAEGYLAKLYTQPPDDARVAKLRAMIAADSPALLEVAAWPVGLVFDAAADSARVLGFVMPEVVDHRELHQLFSPAERKLHFPAANWKMLALAASNLARVVSAIHQSGGVIGDLNQNNVLVSARATVMLIDCDSFQFRRSDGQYWTSDVGKEEYLPPELQSANLRGLVRSPDHDNFALAALVFQLLFMGRHPFSGRHQRTSDFPIGAAIAEGAYFYGRNASQKGLAPPPGVITPAVLPADIASSFELAFLSTSRPTARQWADRLLKFAADMIVCPQSSRHLFHEAAGACPWCALKKAIRLDYFPEPAPSASVKAGADLLLIQTAYETIYASIQSTPEFNITYSRASIAKTKLRAPTAPPAHLARPEPLALETEPTDLSRTIDPFFTYIGFLLLFLSVVVLFVIPKFGVALTFIALANLAIIFSLEYFGLKRRHARWLETCEDIRIQNQQASQQWYEAHADWLTELDSRKKRRDDCLTLLTERENQWLQWLEKIRSDDTQLRHEAAGLQQTIADRLKSYQQELDDQTRARQTQAVEQWLESHLVRDADIPQIGCTRVAMLASFGIETAADVVRMFQNQSYAIPGFSQRLINNLWYWAADVQSRYKPDASSTLPLDLALKIKSRYEPEIATHTHRLQLISQDLAGYAPLVESKKPKVMAFLQQATKDYLEAETDVQTMETIAS
jgi:DNA-binding helix-hairpin-helix protein with protein kinase domain